MTGDGTLRDLLTARARRFSKRLFLEFGDERYSFGSVDDRTDRAASGLSRLGLRAGDRIALLLSNRPECVFFLLGAPKLGIVPVPIDTTAATEEVLSCLSDSDAPVVIAERRFGHFRSGDSGKRAWVVVDDAAFFDEPFFGLSRGPVLGFWPELEPDSAAIICRARSRGGRRRAAVLSHRNILSSVSAVVQPFRVNETDRFLCAMPLVAAGSIVAQVLTPWAAGASCVLVEAHSPRTLNDIVDTRATVLAGTPPLYASIAAAAGFGEASLGALRLAICHSGAVDGAVLKQFEERHDALIVEAYELAEAAGLVCANPYTGLRKPGSLGRPLPGIECRIAGSDGRAAAAGSAGQIQVRGPTVMREYFRDPESTTSVFRDGWLSTGDDGFVDSDGYYHLSGAPRF